MSVLLTICGALINSLAFSCTVCFFGKLMDHGEKEDKIHDLALAKIRKGRDKLNQAGLVLSIKLYEKKKWGNTINQQCWLSNAWV